MAKKRLRQQLKAGEELLKEKLKEGGAKLKRRGQIFKEKIREKAREKKKIILSLVMLLVITIILSATIGRQISTGRTPDLYSFATVHFAGYLFFLLMPVEALVPYYLSQAHSGLVLVVIALATAMFAQFFDYLIGRLASDRIINGLIGQKRLQRAEGFIERYGPWTILLFNLSPLSSPIVVAAAGAIRFGLYRTMLYSFMGLVVKYLAIVYLFGVFSP